MNILVTGGAGYIGSHTCLELLASGHSIAVLDNLSNSKKESLNRVKKISGADVPFFKIDLRDRAPLDNLFASNSFDAVIHFAGLKAVGESNAVPLKYYNNNIAGTLNLLNAMRKHNTFNIVFSSSATVYGDPASVPITEDFPLHATNPYGRTKLMVEEILRDLYNSDNRWGITLLRYFNPVGAHISGLIGEDPNGIPNNLMPYIAQVAIGKLEQLRIFGNDYPTPDGTGVRDYIHVVDLANGHLKAIDHLNANGGLNTYNLGTGHGYSVLQMLHAFSSASGIEIPYEFAPRRPGDVASCYADPAHARKELGWSATRGIKEMCSDTWKWQQKNPKGYEK